MAVSKFHQICECGHFAIWHIPVAFAIVDKVETIGHICQLCPNQRIHMFKEPLVENVKRLRDEGT